MNKNQILMCFVLPGVLFSSGCDGDITKRHYKEVTYKKASPKMSADAASFRNRMPQDEIHANLDMQTSDPDMQKQLQASVDTSAFSWKLPKNWSEKAGSGMRLATLTNEDKNFPVEISVISLAGSAGGLNANITRWMRQVQIPAPDSQGLSSFVERQRKLTTQSDQEAILIDFTMLQGDGDDLADSMIASIIDTGQAQIFLKMMGSKAAVIENKEHLATITQSIQMNN